MNTVSVVVCPSVSEGGCGVIGKTFDSSCCWIPFPRANILASAGVTGLPLFDIDQSVGVPCRCKEVGEGVRCGGVGHIKGPRDSSWLAVLKSGSTGG